MKGLRLALAAADKASGDAITAMLAGAGHTVIEAGGDLESLHHVVAEIMPDLVIIQAGAAPGPALRAACLAHEQHQGAVVFLAPDATPSML